MADTPRTLAEIIALLADNTSGGISEQDIRDMVMSVVPSMGGIYVTAPIETEIANVNEWTKVEGVTALSAPHQRYVDMPLDGRLRYTGGPDHHFHLVTSVSITAASNNQNVEIAIAKAGVILPGDMERKIANGADVGSTAIHSDVTLSTSEYVEVWVRNTTSAAHITFSRLYLYGMGVVI